MATSKKVLRQQAQGVFVNLDIDFDDTYLKNIKKACKKGNVRHIRFGWIDKKKYPSGHKNEGTYIASVAYWQEFGTISKNGDEDSEHIHPRPYFRQFVNKVKFGYNEEIKKYFQSLCTGLVDDTKLTSLATYITYDYFVVVSSQSHKKLSPITIRIKGNSYQLDDTGVMLDSFKAKVFQQSFENIKGSK